ncbi:MAG: AAA family ATPase [Leptospiraceae bacterium]|nr:AAA family ATPase [Leptospiraceae bacterium]
MQSVQSYRVLEKKYESIKSVVFSAIDETKKKNVFLKLHNTDHPDPKSLLRYQLEFSIGKNFNHEGIIEYIEIIKQGNNLVIVTEDFNGITIGSFFASNELDINLFVELSKQIVIALEEIHSKNVVHKDINPQNIIIDPITHKVKIIDFGISSQITRETQNAQNPELLEGTLSYISPEQTGRMNRSIDYRSDYYSLGATFYEILTKSLPFSATDPMELIHCHIAKSPIPPNIINPKIPEFLSDIILKLMSKSADDRYQTAKGILYDLSLVELSGEHELGTKDKLETFIAPTKLYGREKEVETILNIYSELKNGGNKLLLLSGYSGVGKTSIIREIHKPVLESKSYFVEGKFDQFKRNIPYDSILQAISSILKLILTENTSQVKVWKEKIISRLNENLDELIKVIPELESLVGNNFPKKDSSEIEIGLTKLISVFASKDSPFVLFLDDLQWADSETLKLIHLLMTDPIVDGLFLIGAYRDNEVNNAHPLILTIEKIKKIYPETVTEIVLNPLKEKHIQEYLSDAFKHPKEDKNLIELRKLVFERTGGNPFFLGEYIKTLCEEKILFFDESWKWNLSKAKEISATNNVVELMVSKLQKLKPETKNLLILASYLGNLFSIQLLSILSKQKPHTILKQLDAAIQKGYILPIDENYKFYLQESNITELPDSKFKFLHDRIHEASYLLSKEADREKTHLEIARLMIENFGIEKEEYFFDIVNHLNSSARLIESNNDKKNLVEWNIRASIKAKSSSAYEVALNYLNSAKKIFQDSFWETDFEIGYKLFFELIACEYICGNFDSAHNNFEILKSKARNKIETTEALILFIELTTNAGKHGEVFTLATEALKNFGIDFNMETIKSSLSSELKLINSNLKGKNPEDLLLLPEMNDPEMICLMKLLTTIHASVFFTDKIGGTYLCFKMVNLSLQYGNDRGSSIGYCIYGASLTGLGDSTLGQKYCEVAIQINKKWNAKEQIPKLSFIFGATVNHWVRHVLTDIPIYDEGIESGLESGDMIYVGFLFAHRIANQFFASVTLDAIIAEAEKNLPVPYVARSEEMSLVLKTTKQMSLCLQGKTESPTSFTDSEFNEEEYRSRISKVELTSCILLYNQFKAQCHYFREEYTECIQYIENSEKYLGLSGGFYIVSEAVFNSSLVYLAILDSTEDESKRKEYLSFITKNQKKMKRYAEACPENFQFKLDIVQAELNRIEKKELEAMRLYDSAFDNAVKGEFLYHAGIISELAAKFYLGINQTKIAKLYLNESVYHYHSWGAETKIKQLETKYPELINKSFDSKIAPTVSATISLTRSATTHTGSSFLDVSTITKASQAISGEIVLSNLLEKMLSITIENAGAERAILFLEKEGEFFIEAEGNLKSETKTVLQSIPIEGAESQVAKTVLNYVIRTKTPVVLGDASRDFRFNKDPYILSNKIKSLLCVPIMNKGKLNGIFYLENNLATNTFTGNRLEILNILAGQCSISIENARLYTNMSELNESYSKFVPTKFLELLGKKSITEIGLGDFIQKNMAVLFSDIRSFTSLSEKMTPEENFRFINSYLKRVGPLIRKNNGFIDKFIGDAIMALFSGSSEDPLLAAIEMQKNLLSYNQFRIERNYPPITIGIGIHRGNLMLGTIGESERMDGTVISDSVNLASRIEGLTKYYGSSILVSESIIDTLPDKNKYRYRVIDKVKVKGKTLPVTIIEILEGQIESKIELYIKTKEDFEKATIAYLEKNFDRANYYFRKVIAKNEEDFPAKIYLQRAEYYAQHGAPPEWEGVEEMKEK